MRLAFQEIGERVRRFIGDDFAIAVNALEGDARGLGLSELEQLLLKRQVDADLFRGAFHIKRAFGQIDEVIHTAGILLALPKILMPEERVQGLSLAAGNTGQKFDLETTHRIAEFTFISWQGGPEVIRQNKIFKDFFFLAEEPTGKRKDLYVMGTSVPLKFFNSRRSLKPILKNSAKLGRRFDELYPQSSFTTVSDYYRTKAGLVNICDLSLLVPTLTTE